MTGVLALAGRCAGRMTSAWSLTPPEDRMVAWLHLAPGGTLVAWSVCCSLARAPVAAIARSITSPVATIARVGPRARLFFPLPTRGSMVPVRRAVRRRCGLIVNRMDRHLTRRELVRDGLAAGSAVAGLSWASGLQGALAARARPGRLGDIEHVVIFIQENRSFDHYFGTHRGVRGFGDRHAKRLRDGSGLPVFAQPGYPVKGYGGHLYPFHLDPAQKRQCTHHNTLHMGPPHPSWNHGAMDGFVREHMKSEGVQDGALTMGYYRRGDLAYYHALADAFTICDNYHCSVIGPTDPNQLYLVSATLDPAGRHGGPLVETTTNRVGKFSWTTMPERLRAHGISC